MSKPGFSRRKIGIAVLALLALALAAALVGIFWARGRVAGSLPVLDGEIALEGLSGPVTITRDDLGIPTIRGKSRIDVARALGFLHGQERFFQMDLMRRAAAGELAEIVGRPALPMDRQVRFHRFRHRSKAVMETISGDQLAITEAYAEGVNAGLLALDERPFEYLLLEVEPEPWLPEDSVLVIHAMFLDLNDEEGMYEATEALMYEVLPWQLAEFLAPAGCEWDAPINGVPWPTPAIPGPDVVDLRSAVARGACLDLEDRPLPGSNNWVVSARRSKNGRALLASDMHLGISVPNIWYRAVIEWPGPKGTSRVAGVTLPGAAAVVAGSNTHVAWGFTNSYGDWVDLVVVETDPRDSSRYRTPDGTRPFEKVVEMIEIKGEPAENRKITTTIWGPVIDHDHEGRPRALRWTAHDTEAVNLEILGLESARSVKDVLALAPAMGIPPQNIVVADSKGHIGWTIAGRIPIRKGWDGRLPVSWADGTRGWKGWYTPDQAPRVVDPDQGFIWTANARVVDSDLFEKVGHGGYSLGARASQIRDSLAAHDQVTERQMLEIQLDDRALFLSRWRDLLLGLLDGRAVEGSRPRAEFRRLVDETWTGHASVDSVSYRLVREFRLRTFAAVYGWLTAPCAQTAARFDLDRLEQWEGPLWKLVTEKPPHFLDPTYRSWDQALLDVVDMTIESLPKPLSERTWGERNTASIRHPLSLAVPALSFLLDMEKTPLPGDSHMPRVLEPDFGASERFVVSPGREDQGIFHMPCGQSGNPLSPFYRAGHQAWLDGSPTPFLPGKTVHTLTLVPE